MFTTLTSDILCRSLYGRKMNIRGTLSFELLYYLYKQHNNDVIRFASLGRATRCSCLGLSSAAATSLGSCAPKGNGASARSRFEINYCVKSTGKKSTERFSQQKHLWQKLINGDVSVHFFAIFYSPVQHRSWIYYPSSLWIEGKKSHQWKPPPCNNTIDVFHQLHRQSCPQGSNSRTGA